MLHNEAQRRERPLGSRQEDVPESWRVFIEAESFTRLYFCTYCLLLCVSEVFGIQPPIFLVDCALPLPCCEREWTAPSEESWRSVFIPGPRVPTPDFRTAWTMILSGHSEVLGWPVRLDTDSGLSFTMCSSLGGYILILSIFMHSYNLSVVKRSLNPRMVFHANRVTPKNTDNKDGPSAFMEQFPANAQILDLKTALKRWQLGWKENPEALMSPINPAGPVSFNSTAHYRVTNLRLYRQVPSHESNKGIANTKLSSDLTSIRRRLRSQDPNRVFQAMAGISDSPIHRTEDVTNTTLWPAIAALQIPVRMGVRVFSRTASLTWSIEHFLTGFECALFLAYWLLSLERDTDPVLSEQEVEMKELVITLIQESGEETMRSVDGRQILSVAVLRIWASIFDNVCVWGGKTLRAFIDWIMLT